MAGRRDEEPDRSDEESEAKAAACTAMTAARSLRYRLALTSARIFSANCGLSAQVESLMRHCAIVNPHPQVHGSSFNRFKAIVFCAAVKTVKSDRKSTRLN